MLVAIGLGALTIVIACTQLAYVIADSGPTIFGARSQVQYQGSSWVETQSERVNSRTLLEPIAIAHDIPIVDFESNWEAGQVLGTQILQFEYHDADPDIALSVVEAVTARYLAQAEAAASVPNPAAEAYDELEVELVSELAVVEARIADLIDLGTSPELTSLLQEKGSLRAAIDSVRLAQAQINLFGQSTLVPQLVTDPFVLSQPVGPLPAKRAVFGFLGGSILAVGLGFLALRTAANRRQLPPAFAVNSAGLLASGHTVTAAVTAQIH